MSVEKLSKKLFEQTLKCANEDELYNLIVKLGLNKRKGTINGLPFEWKYFGGNEGNVANVTSTNQVAVLALVEKLINSQDAILLKFCREQGIDPTSKKAPQNVFKAIEKFLGIKDGDYKNAKKDSIVQLRDILLVMESSSQSKEPTLSLLDKGCGISHADMESTILSDSTSNKSKIPFLTGKYSRGGLAMLNFLGNRGMQTILSKPAPSCTNVNDPLTENWSFTLTQKLLPSELIAYGFGEQFKFASVIYLTIKDIVPHFPASSIKVSMGKISNTKIKSTTLKHGFSTMEYGTWLRMFDFNINDKVTQVAKVTGVQDIMKLNNVAKICLPQVAYPINAIQPINKADNPYIWNSCGLMYALLDNQTKAKNRKYFCDPISFNTPTKYGDITTHVFLFDGLDESKKFLEGSRGAFWQIDNQWQHIESIASVESTWGMGVAKDHVIIINDLNKTNDDFKSLISSVDREKLRGSKEFNPIKDQVIRKVNDLKEVAELKDLIHNSALSKMKAKNGASAISKLFSKVSRPTRASRSAKNHKNICSDGNDLVGSCGKTSKLKDKISKIELIDEKFKFFHSEELSCVVKRKEVDLNSDGFRIQFSTDASKKFFDKFSIACHVTMSHLNSEDLFDAQTASLEYNSHGVLTLTILRHPDFDNVEGFNTHIHFFPKDRSVCDHASFSFDVECHNTTRAKSPTSSSKNPSQTKKSSQSGNFEIPFDAIRKNATSNYKVHYNPNKEDNNIDMSEDDLIGFTINNNSRYWVINIDNIDFKKCINKIIKDEKLNKKDSYEYIQSEYMDYFYTMVLSLEKTLQNKEDNKDSLVIDTSSLTYTAETLGTGFVVIFREILQSHLKNQKVLTKS